MASSGAINAFLQGVFGFTFHLLRLSPDFLSLTFVLHALIVSGLTDTLFNLSGCFIEVAFHFVFRAAHGMFLSLRGL